MAPLVTLVGSWIVLRLIGLLGVDALDAWHPALRGALTAMFVLTTIAHFAPPLRRDLIAMVPPGLPRPALLVTVTGLLELAGAVGLLVTPTYRAAAICLALLMIAMFPANVHAARAEGSIGGRAVTRLGPRSAEQVLYVACCVAVALF